MTLLHSHSSSFGDNPATDGLLTALRRSDSGEGGAWLTRAALPRRLGKMIRATADHLAERTFGADVDTCRALGRYMIARAIPNPFVFTCPPEPPNSSPWRAKTKPAPSRPRRGRGRPLHAITGAFR